jgi:hypothetical protein
MLRLINALSNIVIHMLVDVNIFPTRCQPVTILIKTDPMAEIQPSDPRAKNGWRDPPAFYCRRDLSPTRCLYPRGTMMSKSLTVHSATSLLLMYISVPKSIDGQYLATGVVPGS